MKKWLVYLLGIITGVILTFAFAFYVNLSNNSGIVGLEMFEEPGDYMEYSQFEVFKWLNLDVLWLMPMTLLVQLYSLFQMKINNFTMNKRLFLKKTNVHNVSERISIVPKWK